jgi:cyclopropane-fatty-acyl-phospholipid synthase
MKALIQHVQSQLASLPLPVGLVLPDGEQVNVERAQLVLRFRQWSSLARLAAGQIGALGEDYVQGQIALDGTLRDLMCVAANVLPGNPSEQRPHAWQQLLRRAQSLTRHSLARDAQQVQFHYDVSDAFYALWLDPRRVYSCAYYRNDSLNLAQAQEAKLDHVCRKLMLHSGERFLDIGCGWGGLLLWAAEHYGVQATGITLSRNQHAHVSRLIEDKGLAGRVQVRLEDYRMLEAGPGFDKIASIGMFEHVGQANMTRYAARIAQLLRPGGLAMNHGITASGLHNRELGAGMGAFVEKYIFPGGELLHVSEVLRHLAAGGLEMLDTENLRPHYARTLWAWSDALESQLPQARAALEADMTPEQAEQVVRAYRLYLAGSAMSFERGWIALHQILSSRPDGRLGSGEGLRGSQSDYPFRRDYMYPQG